MNRTLVGQDTELTIYGTSRNENFSVQQRGHYYLSKEPAYRMGRKSLQALPL